MTAELLTDPVFLVFAALLAATTAVGAVSVVRDARRERCTECGRRVLVGTRPMGVPSLLRLPQGGRPVNDYVQQYDPVSGDAICNPNPYGTWWWWCEHDGPDGEDHHRVMSAKPGASPGCADCGTRWAVWQHAGQTLAKPVVVAVR